MNANLLKKLFDQIYIINLAERTDRKREIGVQLEKVGLSLDDPVIRLFEAVRPASKGDFPSIGAHGCFMSHMGVLADAIAADHSNILILEDDVDWTPMALTGDPGRVSVLQETDWDYLHGGLGDDTATTADCLRLEALEPEQIVYLAHFVGLRGEAIAKSHRFFAQMLERPAGSAEGGPMHLDGAYNWFRQANPEIRSYICRPSLARQRSSKSDITPKTGVKALPVVSHVLSLARSLRKWI
ncbi:MAG: glycosyltransferase family 25 protein [Pseudomonadota bacterium]